MMPLINQYNIPPKINNYRFDIKYIHEIEEQEYTINYPVVYILYDTELKTVYVGESTNVINRLRNHLSHRNKKQLKQIYIISCSLFNKSVSLDIESSLIMYFKKKGSTIFENVLNGNGGLANHGYYQKYLYAKMVDKIWSKLKYDKVVHEDIIDIKNSDLFKYSPYKVLSPDQNSAILDYLEILLLKDRSSVFIEGSAGTGKTILAVYLIKLLLSDYDPEDYENKDDNVRLKLERAKDVKEKISKIALVVPMKSLRETLKKVFISEKGLSASMVIGPSEVSRNEYDILVVDEAHRLHRRRGITNYGSFDKCNQRLGLDNSGTELDWIKMRSNHQLFFYDDAQSIRPSDIPKEKFHDLKKQSETIKLKSQMRINSGGNYIQFVHSLLNPSIKEPINKFTNNSYDLKLFKSLPIMLKALKKKEEELKLCRLIAGYSWKWVSRNTNQPDAIIDGESLTWNRVPHDWINSTTQMNEMGCIHTTQGYDLNYAGIIFGKEIVYNEKSNSIDIIRENYFDMKGRVGITDINELKIYIINIYKTLMYRGIKGSYIYCCDKKLHKYFSKYMTNIA